MTIIKALIRFLLAIVILLMIFFSFLLSSYGLPFVIFITEKLIPGQLYYQKIDGLLIGPINITHLDYDYKNQHIRIKNLTFNWSPINLLQGELTINHLIADGVTVIMPKSNNRGPSPILNNIPSFKPIPLHLPLSLSIEQAHISNITYGQIGAPSKTIKNIDMNGIIQPNYIAFSAYAHLLKPQPLKIQLSIKGNFKNYKIYTYISDKNNRITLNGVGNQQAITLAIPNEHLLSGNLKGNIYLSWYPAVTCNANWSINIPDLSKIYNGSRGSLFSEGTLLGNLAAPETSGQLILKNVAIENFNATLFQLNWKLLFDTNNLSSFHMMGSQLSYKEKAINNLQIDMTGQLKNHTISTLLNLNKNEAILNSNVHYDHTSWQGTITQLNITHPMFGKWTLKEQTPFFYSPAQFYLKPLCITANNGAFLCTQLQETQKNPWNFFLSGKNIRLANVNHKIATQVKFTGAFSIEAKASGIGETIQNAQLNSDLTPGALTYSISNQFQNVAIHGLHINATINKKNGLKGNAALSLEKSGSLNASIDIPQFTNHHIIFDNKKIIGKLNIDMKNLQWAFLIESVLKVSIEQVIGQLTLDGTLSHPTLHGTTTIKASNFEYTTAQMFVHNITATIEASNNKLLYKLIAYAFNNSPVNLTGNTTIASPAINTQLILKTNNAELIKNNEFDLFTTSTTTFFFNLNSLTISGNIFVPKALLQPVSFSNTLTMPKENVVYIGLPTSVKAEDDYKKTINLNITLGNNVILNAYNMNASLLGNLNLTMSAQKTTLANGRIHIKQGTFKAYGKLLKLTSGSSLSFTHSPINNPTINARAFKTINSNSETIGTQSFINTILVGIYIHGPLNNLQLSLYSEPGNISQADILSYLVLGYASSGTNASSLSTLLTAANTASTASGGLTQPNNFINELKQGLGIQEGDIGTRNETILDAIGNPIETQSAFVVGHHITNRIYVEYSRGTIIPTNTVAVSYRINKNWSIQTSSGSGPTTGTGGDIMYSFSRN